MYEHLHTLNCSGRSCCGGRARPGDTEREREGADLGTADLTETWTWLWLLFCSAASCVCLYVCLRVCDICHRGVRNVTTAIGHCSGACWVHADWLNSAWPLTKQTADLQGVGTAQSWFCSQNSGPLGNKDIYRLIHNWSCVIYLICQMEIINISQYQYSISLCLFQAFGGKRSVIHPQRSVHRPLQPQSAVSTHTHTHTHTVVMCAGPDPNPLWRKPDSNTESKPSNGPLT